MSESAASFEVAPGGRLVGTLTVPGDKSISHRFVMLASLAEGVSSARGFLEGEDALATVAAFRAMGVRIDGPSAGNIRIHGVGLRGLKAPSAALDMGNSGTAMRLLAGLLCAQRFASRLTGDASLSQRPMARVMTPLTQMGASITGAERGRPPLDIEPAPKGLNAIDYSLPVASAQVKSCLLLAGLYAHGATRVREPAPTRDHTERMLRSFGASVTDADGCVTLTPGDPLQACDLAIPADISSAAFFLVGACMAPGSDLRLRGVGMNPTRTGIIAILQRMGADIEIVNAREFGVEPVADLHVRYAPLSGIEIPPELVPLAIDELPAIMVAAATANGDTRLRGAEELRVKESDRIAAVARGLSSIGIAVEEHVDGMTVTGGTPRGGTVNSDGDHRIAMAFAMAALAASEPVVVHDCRNVDTSFPGFAPLAADAGLRVEVR